MIVRYIGLFVMFFTPFSFADDGPSRALPRNIHLGEAFYDAYQGRYFEAITRLEIELGQDYRAQAFTFNTTPSRVDQNSEFSVESVELAYGLPQLAEFVIQAIPEDSVGGSAVNGLAYRLARFYFEKGQPEKALLAIKKIKGAVPEDMRNDELFLRAQIYMANRHFEDAVKILQELQNVKNFVGFAGYNLGIAWHQSGQAQKGFEQIDKVGQLATGDEGTLAIKDKANLILGYRLLESGQSRSAKQYFDRVRLTGPFSNKALLGSGWVDASLGDFERALVPWGVLMARNMADETVQESLLAVPYAYGKLGLYGKAIQLYGKALESFDVELAKLDGSITSIRTGRFLQAVAGDEFRQDKGWVVNLRTLPGMPETHYLLELMSSNHFQESLYNYLDLNFLRKQLATWAEDIDSYRKLIDMRRKYYEPLLPRIDKQIQALDASNKLRMEKRGHVNDLMKSMQTVPQPDLLATPDERNLKRPMVENLRAFEKHHKGDTREATKQIRIRSKRLIGVVQWQIDTAYEERLAQLKENLRQLDVDEQNLANIYDSVFMVRRIAAQSYEHYPDQIKQLIARTQDSRDKVKTLMARQGYLLEEMAINELGIRRKRLEEYQVQVAFAQAELYELANKNKKSGAKVK